MRYYFLLTFTVCLFGFNPANAASIPQDVLTEVQNFFQVDIVQQLAEQVGVKVEGQTVTFEANTDSGISVLQLMQLAVPTLASAIANVNFFNDPNVNPLNVNIDYFVVDFAANSFTISSRAFSSPVEIIPHFMTLSDAHFEFKVTKNAAFTLDAFRISATWMVGSTAFQVEAVKDGDIFTISGSPSSGSLAISDFYSLIGEAASAPSGFDDFSLSGVAIQGKYDSQSQVTTICFTGTPTINGWNAFTLTALYHKTTSDSTFVLGITLQSYKLASLISQIADVDVSSVPVIGTLTLPEVGFTYSSKAIANQFSDCFNGLVANVNSIPKGPSIHASLTLGSKSVDLTIERSTDGELVFDFGDASSLTLDDVASALLPPSTNVQSISLPSDFPNVFSLSVDGFGYDSSAKSIGLVVSLGGTLNLINVVTIVNPEFQIEVPLEQPSQFEVAASGSLKFGSSDLDVLIQRESDGSYYFAGSGSSINIGEILTQFATSFLPQELEAVLQKSGFGSFKILSPSFAFPVGSSSDVEISVSGMPELSGFSGILLSSVIKKTASGASMAVGLDFADTKFSDLLKKLTGVSLNAISMLDRNMKVGVIVSKTTMNGVTLPGATLSPLNVVKGITIAATFSLEGCGNDALCSFMKSTLGSSASFQLLSTIESATSFTLSAGVADISLGSGVTLKQVGLEFKIGTDTSVGLICGLELNNPPLEFTGAVRTNLAEVEVSMTMIGMWEKAFGLDFLSFGNAHFSATIVPAAATLTAFAIGGEIRIGKIDSRKKLVAVAHVGIDVTNPNKNYFYGKIDKASIGNVLDAFGISLTLPKVLKNSGFPKGLEVAFALQRVEVPAAGVIIEPGYKLNGTINILGFSVSALFQILFPSKIKIDIKLSPLNIGGGHLQMYRSSKDKKNGPSLEAEIQSSPPSVSVKASGYVNLFKGVVEREAQLEISDTKFTLFLTNIPFFVFTIESLTVSANYGNIRTASFSVSAVVTADSLRKIEREARSAIDNSAKQATRKINDAQNKVNNEKRKLDAAKRDLQKAQSDLNNAKRSLTNAQNNVNKLCKIKSCGSVCVGCPKTDRKCAKVWGKKRCINVPGWNSCCTRITDPVCVTANAGCQTLRRAAYHALSVAKGAVSAAQGTVNGFQRVVNAAKIAFDVANAVLEGVKRTYQAGAAAASAIVSFGLTGVVAIRRVDFSVAISLVSGGSFSGFMEANFLRTGYNRFGFKLNFKSPVEMGKELADLVFDRLKKRRRRREAPEEFPIDQNKTCSCDWLEKIKSEEATPQDDWEDDVRLLLKIKLLLAQLRSFLGNAAGAKENVDMEYYETALLETFENIRKQMKLEYAVRDCDWVCLDGKMSG